MMPKPIYILRNCTHFRHPNDEHLQLLDFLCFRLLDISSNSNLLSVVFKLLRVVFSFFGYDQNTTNYSLLQCHVNLYKKEQAL